MEVQGEVESDAEELVYGPDAQDEVRNKHASLILRSMKQFILLRQTLLLILVTLLRLLRLVQVNIVRKLLVLLLHFLIIS